MSKKLKIKKGLTLLELIVVLGLMSIITMLIFSFMDLTQKKSNELDVKQQLQHEGAMITENLMSNILESIEIYGIDKESTVANENRINNISVVLNKNYKTTIGTEVKEFDKLKYTVSGGKLSLLGHEKQSSEACEESCKIETPINPHWVPIKVVSEYVKEMKLENKNIVEGWKASVTAEDIETIINDEKGINLKLILVDEYLGEEILHEHTIELNLRNAK